MIIAMDGPAGAGKSTVARLVARRLGFTYLSTGAIYRALALKAIRAGLRRSPCEEQVKGLLHATRIKLESENGELRVLVDSVDATDKLSSPRVAEMASRLAAFPPVRRALLPCQREFGERENIVTEGRDTTTVVFPNAEWKFYLDASPRERARRRARELWCAGQEVSVDEIERQIRERDERDSQRECAPLRVAEDAIVIDTEGITAEQVADKIIGFVQAKTAVGDAS